MHEALVDEMERLEKTVAAAPLPPPPFPGNEQFIPLRTETDLLREGREQRSCLGSYADRVRRRRAYVYRVLHPERATLSIVPLRGTWRIGELKRKFNRPVSKRTLAAARAWLASALACAASSEPTLAGVAAGPTQSAAPFYRLRMTRVSGEWIDQVVWRSVFSIREPEAAILEVERGGKGLVVSRLETREGAPVSPQTRAAVQRWVTRCRALESAGAFDRAETRARRKRRERPIATWRRT